MGRMITYARPDGDAAPAYLAEPEKDAEDAMGIVLVEEWWGLTPHILEIADRYANLGYRVVVPDLFRGRTASVGDEANHLMEGLDFQDAAGQDIGGAVQYLKEKSKKVGVTGYCMGGAVAMLCAMHATEPDAAVIFYGFPPSQAGDPGTIEIPVLCHFAKEDEHFSPDRAREIEKRLDEGKVPHEVYWYDAKHGFCNPNTPGNAGLGNYDAQACNQAWERTTKFWKSVLKE
jgi:carboxymethylenebutenolidase